MALDLKDNFGELDRGKVRNELLWIIDHDFRPDEDDLMALIDEAVEQAYADAEKWASH